MGRPEEPRRACLWPEESFHPLRHPTRNWQRRQACGVPLRWLVAGPWVLRTRILPRTSCFPEGNACLPWNRPRFLPPGLHAQRSRSYPHGGAPGRLRPVVPECFLEGRRVVPNPVVSTRSGWVLGWTAIPLEGSFRRPSGHKRSRFVKTVSPRGSPRKSVSAWGSPRK